MKQRLIDANDVLKLIPSEEFNSKFAVISSPTVEAIPVEWIIKYDANLCHSPYCSEDDDKSYIERMIDDWRKENEVDRC